MSAELIEELDIALAALRRVIVRAIERPSPSLVPAQSVSKPAVPPPGKRVSESSEIIVANAITVMFAPPSVAFNGKSVDLTFRQAQVAGVLAKAVGKGFIPRVELTHRAWGSLAESSRKTLIADALAVLRERLAPLGLTLNESHGFGVSLAVDLNAEK